MHPLRHAGTQACSEQEVPSHRPVHQGSVTEAKEAGGGGTAGDIGEGLSGLWQTFGDCDSIQISGNGDDGGG